MGTKEKVASLPGEFIDSRRIQINVHIEQRQRSKKKIRLGSV